MACLTASLPPVPQTGNGPRRHPITLNEIPIPDGQAIIDIQLKAFTEIKPDLSRELRVDQVKLTFDLLVELDLTARRPTTARSSSPTTRSCAAEAFAHPRYQAQGTRPALMFASPRHAHRTRARPLASIRT